MFPNLTADLDDSIPDGTALDTEVVVYRDGRLNFDALQHRMSHGTVQAARLARTEPASLVAFDLILDARTDLRRLPWEERHHRLEAGAPSRVGGLSLAGGQDRLAHVVWSPGQLASEPNRRLCVCRPAFWRKWIDNQPRKCHPKGHVQLG